VADLVWVKRNEWMWQAEARHENGVQVSPAWEVWCSEMSGIGKWCPRMWNFNLSPFACDTAEQAKAVAQGLENVRQAQLLGLPSPKTLDAAVLSRLQEWNLSTFGPGTRTASTLAHIRRELIEIENSPADITEWADVIILAFNGVMRAGHAPQAVLDAVRSKLTENETRSWPDWRDIPDGTPIEHVKE
jgi:hypothetical protein